jgi:hypothetical protein
MQKTFRTHPEIYKYVHDKIQTQEKKISCIYIDPKFKTKKETPYSVSMDLLNGIETTLTKKFKEIHNCKNCKIGIQDDDQLIGAFMPLRFNSVFRCSKCKKIFRKPSGCIRHKCSGKPSQRVTASNTASDGIALATQYMDSRRMTSTQYTTIGDFVEWLQAQLRT